MATVVRTYRLDYGAVSIGGAAQGYLLDSPIITSRNYHTLTVSCTVLLYNTVPGNFELARQFLFDEFRKPYQDLVITRSGVSQTFSVSDNSGFNHQPSITRIPHEADNALGARFEVTVTVELPANLAGDNGLADLSSVIAEDPVGRLMLAVKGSYTALGNNLSTAQYKANIDALITSLKTEAMAVARWDTVSKTFQRDKEDRVTVFDHRYMLATDRERVDSADDPEILNSETHISVEEDGSYPLPDSGQDRAHRLIVTYSCLFLRTANIVGNESALWEKWLTVILPNLKDRISAYLQLNKLTDYTYVRIAPEFDLRTPSLTASIEVVVAGGPLLEGRIGESYVATPPWKSIPMHRDNLYSKAIIPVHGSASVTMTVSVIVHGDRKLAVSLALQLLPRFPSKATFGLGSATIQFGTRFAAVKASKTKDWSITLNDRMEGRATMEVQGPSYIGLDSAGFPIQAWGVVLMKSAEYLTDTPVGS